LSSYFWQKNMEWTIRIYKRS